MERAVVQAAGKMEAAHMTPAPCVCPLVRLENCERCKYRQGTIRYNDNWFEEYIARFQAALKHRGVKV
jgi:hypothetical protein